MEAPIPSFKLTPHIQQILLEHQIKYVDRNANVYTLECIKGHRFIRTDQSIYKNGLVCRECRADSYITPKMQARLDTLGFRFISKKKQGKVFKFELECSQGHQFWKWNGFITNSPRCPHCNKISRQIGQYSGHKKILSIHIQSGNHVSYSKRLKYGFIPEHIAQVEPDPKVVCKVLQCDRAVAFFQSHCLSFFESYQEEIIKTIREVNKLMYAHTPRLFRKSSVIVAVAIKRFLENNTVIIPKEISKKKRTRKLSVEFLMEILHISRPAISKLYRELYGDGLK